MNNKQEIMEDKDAANTIMFLFFQLDDYDRKYFLEGLEMGGSFDYIPRKCEDFILNCIKHYFDPIHSILAEDEDYKGSYHWAEYDHDQKIRLKKIRDLFVDYFCNNEGNDYLDQIIYGLSVTVYNNK